MAEPITRTVQLNEPLPAFADTGFTDPRGQQFISWNTERDGSGTTFLD